MVLLLALNTTLSLPWKGELPTLQKSFVEVSDVNQVILSIIIMTKNQARFLWDPIGLIHDLIDYILKIN